MSEIRQLLAAAQTAEVQGDLPAATRLLLEAARWYEAKDLLPRARQMLRHVERLTSGEQVDRGEDLGSPVNGVQVDREQVDRGSFDEDPFDPDEVDGPEVDRGAFDQVWDLGDEENAPSNRTLTQQRRPFRAPDDTAAWCSFCCRPKEETGPLVAGPQGAGAFICAECIAHASGLLGPKLPADARPAPAAPALLLRQQANALQLLRARRPRLTLLTGPAGTGKTALLTHLGGPHLEPWPDQPLLVLDLPGPLSEGDERRLLRWLDADPTRQLVLAVRADAPAPAMVLRGPVGDERLYDTQTLRAAIPVGSDELVTRIELVLVLAPPDPAELKDLATARLEARGITLPQATLEQLLGLAARSTRPVSELLALINRIPPGTYEAP